MIIIVSVNFMVSCITGSPPAYYLFYLSLLSYFLPIIIASPLHLNVRWAGNKPLEEPRMINKP